MRRAALSALILLAPVAAGAACVDVPATSDWVPVGGEGVILDVHAVGTWTAEDGVLAPVGPGGHDRSVSAGEGARIVPPYPLGALVIANGERRVWDYETLRRTALGAMMAGQGFAPGLLYARINDTPSGLGDNAGAITLCIEIAAE